MYLANDAWWMPILPIRWADKFNFNWINRWHNEAARSLTWSTSSQSGRFNQFGRRTITVQDQGRSISLPQGITRISPAFARLQGLRQFWESAVPTASLPKETVDQMLRRTIDPSSVSDRLKLAAFFVQAEWYDKADIELNRIAEEFPQVAETVQESLLDLARLRAERILQELKLRRRAGQHSLAYRYLQKFPQQDVPVAILSEVSQLLQHYDQLADQLHELDHELNRLLRAVGDNELQAQLVVPLMHISEMVSVESIPRLERFWVSRNDDRMSAEDRLALAVSGWVAGNAFAEPRVGRALRLWEAKELIGRYLTETSPAAREKLVQQLNEHESLSVELAAEIVRRLAPQLPAPRSDPGKPARITVDGPGGPIGRYHVLLPPEYNPQRQYPLIVTLHGKTNKPEEQIGWWAAQAARRGYIVAAPWYVVDPMKGYQYSGSEHIAVLAALTDLRRRYAIDSDRVFLSGPFDGRQGGLGYRIGASGTFRRRDSDFRDTRPVLSPLLEKRQANELVCGFGRKRWQES